MKKRTKIIIFTVPLLVVIALLIIIKVIQNNEYYSHPIYYTYDKGNDHQSFVMVDGIEYQAGCILDSNQIGDIIGFLNDKSYPIYRIKGDVDNNFLYIKISGEMPGYWGYYRSDFIFPEVSADAINKMKWWDSTCRNAKTISDQSIIDEFYKEISNKKSRLIDEKILAIAQINLYFSNTTGFCYEVSVYYGEDGSFYCQFPGEAYNVCTKISLNTLEHIAGHKLNIDEAIEYLQEYE